MSLLAIDIGSSRIKALLADWDGRVVEVRRTATPRQSIEPGEQSFPADAVQAAIEGLIAGVTAVHRDQRVETLVFSCLGTAMVPLDRAGEPLGPALAPADGRPLAGPGLDEGIALDAADLLRRTGSDPSVASSLLHALWWKREHPEIMEALHRFRSLRGYALAQLCGADAEDPTWASRTMLFDLETGAWSDAIVSAAGLPGHVLPEIAAPTSTWPVRESAVGRLGLAPGAVVVLGAMDNCCSLLGATLPAGPGLVNVVGTYEHMAGSAGLDDARAVAEASGAVIHAYVVPGRFITMTRVPLGRLLALVGTGAPGGLDRLLEGVSETPTGADLALDPEAVQAAIRAGRSRGDVLQSILEAAAAQLKRFADVWPGAKPADRVAVVGGGARHDAALQLKANVLGRPLATLASPEGAGLGALRLTAMSTRSLSLDSACELFPNPATRTFRPDVPWPAMPTPTERVTAT